MKTGTIEELAYLMKEAENRKEPQPIFLLGAGASRTGNIPLANEIVKDILNKYSNSPFIAKLNDDKNNYAKLMGCLQPLLRNELLKSYIDNAKINVTHIYLAQLLKNGFVDYVLTVNFDNLMLRALSLYNEFPATYDMAILKDLTTTTFRERSVVYLHGQYHGLWLLNTNVEMEKVELTLPRIFDSIKNKRIWVIIGYSGNDPVFNHIKNLGRFDNGLYWVGYKDKDPGTDVKEFLNVEGNNCYFIDGYDSDSFMIKLNEYLGLNQPQILDKPFSCLKTMIDGINDINDEDHFKGVKERLEIVKKDIDNSIRQFELKESIQIEQKELNVDKLKKDIIDILISEKYDNNQIEYIENKAFELNNESILKLLSDLYGDWGNSLGHLAATKSGDEADTLYREAFKKYERAVEVNKENALAYSNWGAVLGRQARTKSEKEADTLYRKAFEKYGRAVAINPNDSQAYYNWGAEIGSLAITKTWEEAEELYREALEKYERAVALKPDHHQAYYNWGNVLGRLAVKKSGEEAEELHREALEKYERAVAINPNYSQVYCNWGYALGNLASTKSGEEAEELYRKALEKYERAVAINPNYSQAYCNWGNALGRLADSKSGEEADALRREALEKYKRAIGINPNDSQAYYNWGTELERLADSKSGGEVDTLRREALEKYERAVAINPNDSQAYYNWGTALGRLADSKSGEEADALYREALEKYERAVALKTDDHQAYFNWGNALGSLAVTKSGEEADELYREALEKYERAVALKPDYPQVYYNWGDTLGSLASTKSGKEVDGLYEQAIEKYQKAVKLGKGCYNLSCIYALKQDKENALKYLEKALSNNEIEVDFVLEDEDWSLYIDDSDFITLIERYQKKDD